jgi:transcriptional regulator NrdR family protein
MLKPFICPTCGSTDTRVYATPTKYKAQQIRYRKCKECTTRFCTKQVDGTESLIGFVQTPISRT